MLRSVVLWGLFLFLGAAVLSDAAPASRAEGQRADTLAGKLQQPTQFPPFEDKKSTLQELLDFASDRYEVTFDINDAAFKNESLADVEATNVIAEKPLRIK